MIEKLVKMLLAVAVGFLIGTMLRGCM